MIWACDSVDLMEFVLTIEDGGVKSLIEVTTSINRRRISNY